MALAAGSRLGPYEIVSLVGVGGMGEVYKGRDTRLDRTVAIKLLPADVAERPDRRARFEVEARAISALNHPHICTLFDVGDQDGRPFIVMEYLEGETLDDRMTSGALPARDVVRYALQIADALAHAHRAQIVHRDLKPSNVMVTSAGAKLLDFGLARRPIVEPAGGTLTTVSFDHRKLTAEGTILGTFQYMAPEQLEGKEADARTDIFAFGTLLYEMATGKKAFDGSSQASLIASILTAQPPPISATGSSDGLPPSIDHIVERCLAKNPDDRWQTARDLKLELEWIGGDRPVTAAAPQPRRRHWRETLAWAVAVVAAAIAISGRLRVAAPPSESIRFVVVPPSGTLIQAAENSTRIALSPDARHLAFVASTGGQSRIWVRPLGSLTARPLEGTDGALAPFWSPDGRFVGYFSRTNELKKADISGGPPRLICVAPVEGTPTWGRDGTILFNKFLDGIYRVSADGGVPTRVTQVDKARRELNHYWPSFLPDGRHFLYTATALDAGGIRDTPSVYVGTLDSTDVKLIARVHSKMLYAPPGYLLFVEEGTLLARAFDVAALEFRGEPVKIADGVGYFKTVGNAAFSVSTTGVIAYQGAGDSSQLVWFDRRGNATETEWGEQTYGRMSISPDGNRVAVDVTDPRTGTADIWIYDVARGAPVRFTSYVNDESGPVWSPDGRRILFRMNRGGTESLRMGSAAPNLYAKTVGGAGEEELIVADPEPLFSEDWSPDGQWIVYNKRNADLFLLPLAGDRKPRPFRATRFIENDTQFSPDSAHIAFVSSESGPPEVYVTTIRESGETLRISVGGGAAPRWRGDGKELFYASADRQSIMAVPIESSPTFQAGIPRRLFTVARGAAMVLGRSIVYDVTPDGERFLVSVPGTDPESSRVTVVLNWTSALTSSPNQAPRP